MSNIINFLSVSKTYDGSSAVVRDLNLEVQEGEFLTLLGPSGSGKTTTLMMLAGFEAATSGEIYVKGVPITRMPAHKRNLGMVFQNYALFPHMSVAENICFPLKVRGVSRAEMDERMARALSMVALEKFGDRRPNQLSGGQQQRVAIARALVFNPPIILMDEPLGALDKQLRDQMQYEIKRLHEKLGLTFIYVTHDQTEALSISTRIAVFRSGVIEQLDTPSGLYDAPRSSFVAQFIGENNRLAGTVVSRDDGACRVALDIGPQIEATPAAGLLPDHGAVTLSVRPECILLNDEAAAAPNRLQGKVQELVYLGDHRRVHVAVGDQSFLVKLASGRFPSIRVGDAVTIGWRAGDCRAFEYVN